MGIYNEASLIMYPSGYKRGKIYCQKPTDGSGDITFSRASTATRVNESGLIEEVASGVPRIDYSGGGCGKLLLEPQRTNLVTYSNDFSNASWVKLNTTVSVNDATSPDGTTNADKITYNSGSGYVRSSAIVTAASVFSIFVKKIDFQFLQIFCTSDGGTVVNYDLTNIITGGAGADASGSITDFGNGWILIEHSFLSSGTYGTGVVGIYRVDSLAAAAGTSSTTEGSFYYYGAQLEEGSYPTSYIPTAGSTVTRVKDAPSITNLSTAIGTTNQYVWYVEMHLGSNGAGLSIEPLDITGNRIGIAAINRTQTTIVSGAGQVGTQILTYSDTDIVKVAAKYNAGTFNLFVNGVKASGSATTTASGVLETFRLYSLFEAFKMQSTMLFPLLSDAQLLALTTI